MVIGSFVRRVLSSINRSFPTTQEHNINPETLITPAIVIRNKEEREARQRAEALSATTQSTASAATSVTSLNSSNAGSTSLGAPPSLSGSFDGNPGMLNQECMTAAELVSSSCAGVRTTASSIGGAAAPTPLSIAYSTSAQRTSSIMVRCHASSLARSHCLSRKTCVCIRQNTFYLTLLLSLCFDYNPYTPAFR